MCDKLLVYNLFHDAHLLSFTNENVYIENLKSINEAAAVAKNNKKKLKVLKIVH